MDRVISVKKPDYVLSGNGTEGDMFKSKWCEQCSNHDFQNDEGPVSVCYLLFRMLNYYPYDVEYPKEICFDKDGVPQCTAFAAEKETVEQYRCDNTIDMFGDTK